MLAGAFGWQNEEVKMIYENLKFKTDVIFVGRVEIEELARITGSAFALLYVSLFEGFGVPPLEAMKCGVPVIASNVSSLPEVCGDGALLVSPNSIEQISAAILQISTNESLRQNLIEKGILQAQKFTWKKSAEELWNCCEKLL